MLVSCAHCPLPEGDCQFKQNPLLTRRSPHLYFFLLTKVQGLPLPKEVRNPRWVSHSTKFSASSPLFSVEHPPSKSQPLFRDALVQPARADPSMLRVLY